MSVKLSIHLEDLPEEGAALRGELAADLFDLPDGDARAMGPLQYDLWAQRFDSELLLTGKLSASFQFTCVRTLDLFVQTITLESAAISLEIGQKTEIEVADALREEVLMEFPANPRSDEADEPHESKIDSRYLSVDKPGEDGLITPPRTDGDDRWSALDALKDLKDQP
ncbi:MAG: YceD family protein [Luteolibacter sp.]